MEASTASLFCTLLLLSRCHGLGRALVGTRAFCGPPAPEFTEAVPWTGSWDVSSLWLLQALVQQMELGSVSLPCRLEGEFLGEASWGEGGMPLSWGEKTHPGPL